MAAAAYNVEEEQVWKCQKHPSKRRRNGVCPTCLRDRLSSLCPLCAHALPCACASTATSSATASSPSTSSSSKGNGEPSLRRSRSLAVPFLRSRNGDNSPDTRTTTSFLSILTRSNTKKRGETVKGKGKGDGLIYDCSRDSDENFDSNNRIEEFARMITRSRSVSAAKSSPAAAKRKFWHLPSPMKVFRSYKHHHQRKDIVV